MTEATTPALPQSTALTEASVDSLAVLLDRDPEGYQEQDLDVICAAMRAQRERIEAAQAAGQDLTPKKASPKVQKLLQTSKTSGDLGL